MSKYLTVFDDHDLVVEKDHLCNFKPLPERDAVRHGGRNIGFAAQIGEHTAAFYADNGLLWLEVDRRRWNPLDSKTTCAWGHHGTFSRFTITVNGQVEFSIEYPVWSQHDIVAQLCEWPPDECMDLFAYVAAIVQDEPWWRRTLASWES